MKIYIWERMDFRSLPDRFCIF